MKFITTISLLLITIIANSQTPPDPRKWQLFGKPITFIVPARKAAPIDKLYVCPFGVPNCPAHPKGKKLSQKDSSFLKYVNNGTQDITTGGIYIGGMVLYQTEKRIIKKKP